MILRRLSQSLKAQNWTAIWIEFALLVAGVFLGIQVSNWNEQRATDQKARVFTERLRGDLRVEVWRFQAVNLYYEDVLANARRTLDALEGRSALSNEALLIASYRATQYSEFLQYRATYDELTSLNSPYRVAFRMLVPSKVQDALSANCGDKTSRVDDYESIKKPLDYACTTGLPPGDIDAAAALLRADAALAPLLRLRIANVYSATTTSLMSDEVLANLNALSKAKP